MLVEALLLADPFLRLPGRDGSECRVSESVHDMEAYCRLSDTIFSVIDISSDPRLRPAKDLLRRVRRRDMYAFAGQFVLPHPGESGAPPGRQPPRGGCAGMAAPTWLRDRSADHPGHYGAASISRRDVALADHRRQVALRRDPQGARRRGPLPALGGGADCRRPRTCRLGGRRCSCGGGAVSHRRRCAAQLRTGRHQPNGERRVHSAGLCRQPGLPRPGCREPHAQGLQDRQGARLCPAAVEV